MKKSVLVILFSFCLSQNFSLAQQVNTLAGSTLGFSEGTGSAAQFNFPTGICADSSGNVYVADGDNNRIRKITPDGIVSTLAGSGIAGYANGTGANAKFNHPDDVCVDGNGNVYVSDRLNKRIRKITPDGTVSNFAGSGVTGFTNGSGNSAKFNDPFGICVDLNGNVYVADSGNHKIRKITPDGVVSTFAGSTQGYQDGAANDAKFNYLKGVCVDRNFNVYVADYFNQRIRAISTDGMVRTVAGSTIGNENGQGVSAQFNYPIRIAVDGAANLYVIEEYNHTVRKIDTADNVTTYAGTTSGYLDGNIAIAKFFQPSGIFVGANNSIYVADQSNQKIRTITGRLSIKENEMVKFKIYPNPVNQILNIDLSENIMLEKATIYNSLGQLIKTENKLEINVSDLSKGSYFIKVDTDKGTATKGFIVQ